MKVSQAAHGAASIARTTLGVGRVTKAVESERLATCAACPNKTPAGRCALCECVLRFKARDQGEKCPLGYWKR